MSEVKLPSGAVLKVQPAPFEEAQALYECALEELRGLKLDPQADIDVNFYKDLLCVGMSSKKLKAALAVCMKRCTYNSGAGDTKIDKDTFEPVERREDYFTVCYEVLAENIRPFTKSLFAEYKRVITTIQNALASRPVETP